MIRKPDPIETYLHDINVLSDEEIEAKYYTTGIAWPRYPMPAIDYYNSNNPDHVPIGNLMEWSIPVDIQLKFRG